MAIDNFDEVDLHNEEKVDAALGNMNVGLSGGSFGPGQARLPLSRPAHAHARRRANSTCHRGPPARQPHKILSWLTISQLGVEYPRLWNAKRIMVESREKAALDPDERRRRSRKEAVMLSAERARDLLADLMAWDTQDDPDEGEEEEEGEEKVEPTALEKADELISRFCSVSPRRNVRVALDGSSMHEVSSPACQALSELLVGERQQSASA